MTFLRWSRRNAVSFREGVTDMKREQIKKHLNRFFSMVVGGLGLLIFAPFLWPVVALAAVVFMVSAVLKKDEKTD